MANPASLTVVFVKPSQNLIRVRGYFIGAKTQRDDGRFDHASSMSHTDGKTGDAVTIFLAKSILQTAADCELWGASPP